MKKQNGKSVLGLSLVVAMLLGSSAYAGNIVTNTDEGFTADKQYGFGGWNLDNVDVYITDLEYGNPTYSFDEDDGSYDTMKVGDSFESQITTDSEHRGNLHGKDWPVGEPAGIKIINGDTNVKHGKPVNCIMTSSYLSIDDNPAGVNGYLDSDTPAPTICSSAFQTHKRFKVNLLNETVNAVGVAGGYGEPVDLIFNLDMTDNTTDIVRYQVLQKINNYTDKRLSGYKIEILDGNGAKNSNLTLSLGIGEGDENDDGIIDGDIWDTEEMANMSHGLWGPVQKDRFDNGFFDYIRAYYPVTLSADKQTISYSGEMQGGNYQQIFGNWLPSIWEPTGMFFDDDNDPTTDAELQAFYGVAPGKTELAWWKRTVSDPYGTNPIYTWSQPTVGDMAEWSGDVLYSTGPIEDVLNLGLNYIVEVGDNAQIPTGKFMLRITPHVDTNQTEPLYVGVTPPSTYTASEGQVAITPEPIFAPGTRVTVSVGDVDLNLDQGALDEVNVTVINHKGDEENLTLFETDDNSSVFTNKLQTVQDNLNTPNDGEISVTQDTNVTVTYIDEASSDGVNVPRVAWTIAHAIAKPTADAGADVTVTEGESVTITGTGTVDPYSDYTYYEWKDNASKEVIATTASFDTPTDIPVGTYTLTFKVSDVFGKSAIDEMVVTVTNPDGSIPDDGTDTDGNTPSSGGGGCTYNPNSTSFDMTVLFMMALGALYPFRRRFLK